MEGTLESVTIIDNKSKSKLEAVSEALTVYAFDHVIDKQSFLLSIETEYEFVEVECAIARFPIRILIGDHCKMEVTENARMVLNFV